MTPLGLIPSIAWLRKYRREWLRPDIIAGLTAAAVVIPKAMAYATIAILVAAELGRAVPDGDAGALIVASATLAMLVGATLVTAAVLRFGFVADFISEPVLTGFKSGIGLVIVVDQVPKLLGIHIQRLDSSETSPRSPASFPHSRWRRSCSRLAYLC